MKKVLLFILLITPFTIIAQNNLSIVRRSKIKTDTLYYYQPSYFTLIDSEHNLKHYQTDSLLILVPETKTYHSDDGKYYYTSLLEFGSFGDKIYYYNNKRIYPINVKPLFSNVSQGMRYISTLKFKLIYTHLPK